MRGSVQLLAFLLLPIACGGASPPTPAAPATAVRVDQPPAPAAVVAAPPDAAPAADNDDENPPAGSGKLGGGKLGSGHKGPKLRQGRVSVVGRLPQEVVERIVRQNFGRFRLCYYNGLRTNPTLTGRITVEFVIETDGSVSSPTSGDTTLADRDVVACVASAHLKISFPPPEGGKVTVKFPITFSPADD
jgi:hypothetical protein